MVANGIRVRIVLFTMPTILLLKADNTLLFSHLTIARSIFAAARRFAAAHGQLDGW